MSLNENFKCLNFLLQYLVIIEGYFVLFLWATIISKMTHILLIYVTSYNKTLTHKFPSVHLSFYEFLLGKTLFLLLFIYGFPKFALPSSRYVEFTLFVHLLLVVKLLTAIDLKQILDYSLNLVEHLPLINT